MWYKYDVYDNIWFEGNIIYFPNGIKRGVLDGLVFLDKVATEIGTNILCGPMRRRESDAEIYVDSPKSIPPQGERKLLEDSSPSVPFPETK